MCFRVAAFWLALAVSVASPAAEHPHPIDFGTRVEAQRSIEREYWAQRDWPDTNPAPKPSFEDMLSEEDLRGKVQDYLRKSTALGRRWGRPISANQLQGELDRMARHTRAPQMLRRILEALDGDPALAAETLARQRLADRLIRRWFRADASLQQPIRQRAETALQSKGTTAELRNSGAMIETRTVALEGKQVDATWLGQLLRRGAIPGTAWTPLLEERNSFVSARVVESRSDELVVELARWPKLSFASWWSENAPRFDGPSEPIRGSYRFEEIATTACGVEESWSPLIPTPLTGKYGKAVWTGSEMVVFGFAESLTEIDGNTGRPSQGESGRYDPATDSWTTMSSDNHPVGLFGHAMVWTGSDVIVWGGHHENNEYGLNWGGARYNPATDTWSDAGIVCQGLCSRRDPSLVWTGTEVIGWGGDYVEFFPDIQQDNSYPRNDGIRYDPATGASSEISVVGAPAGRSRHTAVWTGSEMIVWGGDWGTAMNDGGRYDPATDSWQPMSSVGRSARTRHRAVWTGDVMLVWGGNASDFFGTNATVPGGASYDPATDLWIDLSAVGEPSPRADHAAVWTGDELLVWGGTDGTSFMNDGARYDPATDSWSSMAAGGAPSPRAEHVAVWSGMEMLVWAGSRDDAPYLLDGGRYDPALDSWTPLSGGHPEAREHHAAVWTGAEMLIWGGAVDDGQRYDPATASWSPMTSSGDPFVNEQSHAVWTGSEMIVWGGYRDTGVESFSEAGHRYNPQLDQWAPMETIGAPSGRKHFASAWTGTEFIVWGGVEEDGTIVDDGARYDPATDGWASMFPLGAPSAREHHSGIWDGSRFLIWGGNDAGTVFGNGRRYDPASDTWSVLSSINAGGPRSEHIAAWTGDEMLIWGGTSDFVTEPLTGARYDPGSNSWTTIDCPAIGGSTELVATWTGSEWFIWADFYQNARYNPTSGLWLEHDRTIDPVPRFSHTLVWSGEQAFAYSGRSYGGVLLHRSAAYCPGAIADRDGDGQRDDSDNCPDTANQCQENQDFDLRGDVCDCEPTTSEVYSAPTAARNLLLAGKPSTEFTWDLPETSGGSSTTYSVLRSAQPGDFTAATCLETEIRFSLPTATIDDSPSPGVLHAYLIQVFNACGWTIGADSMNDDRASAPCP